MRKKKRTAGQRRYLALLRKVESVSWELRSLQNSMHIADADGKQKRQMHIMQIITESIERLKP